MSLSIKPTGKNVLIRAVKPDAGNVALGKYAPEEAKRAHQRGLELYRVVDVGDGRMTADGRFVPFDLTPGQEVIVGGDTLMIGLPSILYGVEDHFLVDGSAVIAVVDGRTGDKIPASIITPDKRIVTN